MERKRMGLVFVALCLFLGFSVIPAEAAPKENTAKKCSDGKDNDGDGKIDDADPDCAPFVGGGRGPSGKQERITVWFQDGGGYDLQSDGLGNVEFLPNCEMGPSPCYIDGEQKVKAHIGGLTQPNPAGIRLEPNPNGKGPRGIMLNLLTDCEDVLTDGCAKIIPDELKNFSVVAPWVVRAGAYTHSDDPQLIVVGDSKIYLFRITVPSGGVRWVIELASSLAPAGDNGSRGAICGETGQDVTVTGVLDTNGDGLSDKWKVTAPPPVLEDVEKGILHGNARVCANTGDGLVLVARLNMTFEYTAQLK